MKIGIPRALLYYNFYPLWKNFIEELGHDVILSAATSKSTVDNGVKNCVDDACLPIKLFHGHVIELIERVDAIFIPRLTSIYPREYICPKFIGLPEMIKSSIKKLPNLIILNYNTHRKLSNGYNAYMELGKKMSADIHAVTQAFDVASNRQQAYNSFLEGGGTPLDVLEGGIAKQKSSYKGVIGLVGHPYLLYDEYASMNLISKLRHMGYKVMIPENISSRQIEDACMRLPKKLFWSYGKKLLGCGLTMLDRNSVDGIIFLSSFGCGIDAFIEELLQRFNRRQYKIPYTVITVDEHSGHAGFNTRLEAFLDMIQWRDKNGSDFSSHGESLCGSQGLT